jgi:hypothetical protein
MENSKVCGNCKEIKLLDEFYKDKTHKYGVGNNCKICDNIRNKERHAKKPKIIKEIIDYSTITHKICVKCNIEKPLNEFVKRKTSKDGCRGECKECYNFKSREYDKEYRKKPENKIKTKEYNRKYNQNPENNLKAKERKKIYRETPENKLKTREYLDKNREHNNKTRNKRRNERMKTEPLFRLEQLFKVKLRKSLKVNNSKKPSETNKILGCTMKEYKSYLEAQWSLPHNLDENGNVWMNWVNKGKYKKGQLNYGWDIDHITPLSSAKNEEGLIKLFLYTNHQPLCSHVNRHIKRNKLNWKNKLK